MLTSYSIIEAKARLEKQGVAKGHWHEDLDKALTQVKEAMAKMDEVETKAKWYEAWKEDMDRIGEIPCVEPDPYIDALEGIAQTLGSFEACKEALV